MSVSFALNSADSCSLFPPKLEVWLGVSNVRWAVRFWLKFWVSLYWLSPSWRFGFRLGAKVKG